MSGHLAEVDESLLELTVVHEHIHSALRLLRSAPSADPLIKTALESELGQIAVHFQALVQRLDELPNSI